MSMQCGQASHLWGWGYLEFVNVIKEVEAHRGQPRVRPACTYTLRARRTLGDVRVCPAWHGHEGAGDARGGGKEIETRSWGEGPSRIVMAAETRTRVREGEGERDGKRGDGEEGRWQEGGGRRGYGKGDGKRGEGEGEGDAVRRRCSETETG
ncbi:hypothetical protein BJV77DRAFT_967234 [Russula vinacea]|nr:hypothetical protein BJV77DRAFT_967234 [Russula vinacea]